MRSTLRLVAVALLLTGALFLLGRTDAPQYTLEAGTPHLKETSAMFAQEIKHFGGTQAYARMSRAVQGLGIDDQHGYAHAFGHQLYAIEGERGIAVCDVHFGMGCFHQLLGDAIGDLGPGAVDRLYAECGKTAGTIDVCRHGLGHGVVAGTGYSPDNLKTALGLCDRVTKDSTYSGCDGGAFMEYNMRTIAMAEGTMSARAAEHGDLYEPCTSIDTANKKTCTFWLPEWWLFATLKGDRSPAAHNSVYAQMGALCAGSQAPQSCYEGIGYVTPTAYGFDPQQARAACDSVGTEHGGNVYCRGMAALIFHITGGQEGKATILCDGLTDTAQRVCMEYATYRGNNFSFSAPERL